MQRSGPSRKAGGRGTSLPQFLRGFLKASHIRHFGDTKAHESLLSSWSSAWGGIREAAGWWALQSRCKAQGIVGGKPWIP